VFSRPNIKVNNLIFGSLYIDLVGESIGRNLRTGHSILLKFSPKSWSSDSQVSGKVTSADGSLLYELKGCWRN